jgi:hypothetical protein
MPLRVGWHQVIWGFPPGITWERNLKPSGPDLARGALAHVWSYGEALSLVGCHP